jgi:hypothetical protein
MFGYVDRIERAEKTNQEGATSTVFSVIGSDFTKAIDQTCLYFNPHLRERLDARFNKMNYAGTAMRSAGIVAHGTPSDFVENFLQILLGFGQQWQLPKSYDSSLRTRTDLRDLRRRRQQRALSRLPPALFKLLETVGIKRESLDTSFDLVLEEAFLNNVDSVGSDEEAFRKKQEKAASILRGNADLLAYRSVLDATKGSLPSCLNDLLDLTFVESLCVDGYVSSSSVWDVGNQTLAKFLYGNTNSIVNELFFDLRPVSLDGGLSDGPYSHREDELGINVNGTTDMPTSGVAGVQYAPAVVFREYPFSVVQGYDLSQITLLAGRDYTVDKFIAFAPIFAVNPDREGRSIYNFKADADRNGISLRANDDFALGTKPVRHLDVVVIHNTDVRQANVGRSDNDVWNVMEMHARNHGKAAIQWKYQLSNFSPILTPVSIQRHGLRARKEITSFASYVGADEIDNAGTRRNLVRWQLLLDHWCQHNHEYLTGTIALRAMPEIRAGYRLDWYERNESYYVESVKNDWAYPGELSTSVQVSRGQRNDPYPAYIPPVFLRTDNSPEASHSGNRGGDEKTVPSRLAESFPVKDTHATAGATNAEGPFSTHRNNLDEQPFADREGQAEYAYPKRAKRGRGGGIVNPFPDVGEFPAPDRDGIDGGLIDPFPDE